MPETKITNRYTLDPSRPDPAVIARAGKIIAGGGVVVFPTQTLYGLGVNALDPHAVDRIFTIKERPPDKPVLILINSIYDIQKLSAEIPTAARKIIESCWPGGVTIVFRAAQGLPYNLTAGTGKIGIRLPLHPVARELLRSSSVPVTGTSANISGFAGCSTIKEISMGIQEHTDMILDAGALKGGLGSTIVDVTVTPPGILREGTVPERRIREVLVGS
jgi:L-threonylcarbamoyladenylate synthase